LLVCGGAEDDPRVQKLILQPIEDAFNRLQGTFVDVDLGFYGVISIKLNFYASMFDLKLLKFMVGTTLSSGHVCPWCHASSKTAKTQAGTFNCMTEVDRNLLAEKHKELSLCSLGSNGADLNPRQILQASQYVLSTRISYDALIDCPMEGAHAWINSGKWGLEIVIHEISGVYVWNKREMNDNERRRRRDAVNVLHDYLMKKFHLLVRMMAVGNMARVLHDPKNREILLGVIPSPLRRDVIRQYFEFFDPIRVLIKSTQLESKQWLGAKKRLLVPFAKWMQRPDTLGYVGWPWYFHIIVEHLEEFSTRLGGRLGAFSAEGAEASNKVSRALDKNNARPGIEGYQDMLTGCFISSHEPSIEAFNAHRHKRQRLK
jgi:hypothetical protein